MTIYGYKHRLNWTENQSWKESLFPPLAQRAEAKSLFDIGYCTHRGQWSGKRNWLVPPLAQRAEAKSLFDIGHRTHFGQWSGIKSGNPRLVPGAMPA